MILTILIQLFSNQIFSSTHIKRGNRRTDYEPRGVYLFTILLALITDMYWTLLGITYLDISGYNIIELIGTK